MAPPSTDMVTREPAIEQALTVAADRHVLLAQDPMTREVRVLDHASLEEQAHDGPLVVAGRLETVDEAGWRSVWVEHDGHKRLLVIEDGDATWPLVTADQVVLIRSARVVPGSAEAAEELSFTGVSPRRLKRQDVILVSDDDHVEVERTEQFHSP